MSPQPVGFFAHSEGESSAPQDPKPDLFVGYEQYSPGPQTTGLPRPPHRTGSVAGGAGAAEPTGALPELEAAGEPGGEPDAGRPSDATSPPHAMTTKAIASVPTEADVYRSFMVGRPSS